MAQCRESSTGRIAHDQAERSEHCALGDVEGGDADRPEEPRVGHLVLCERRPVELELALANHDRAAAWFGRALLFGAAKFGTWQPKFGNTEIDAPSTRIFHLW